MSTTNKVYTAADFERYHAGSMDGKEMHALERAAMEDPFLADALEGYAYTQTPADDLASLREQLAQKTERKKVFFLSPRAKNGWLRIAAMLIVFAGLGTVFYQINYKKTESGLAVNKPMPVAQPAAVTDSPATIQADTTPAYTATTQATIVKMQPPSFIIKKSTPAPAPVKPSGVADNAGSRGYLASNSAQRFDTVNNQFKDKYYETAPVADLLKKAPSIPVKEQAYAKLATKSAETNAANDYKVEGKVTDDNGQPIAGAEVKVNGSTAAITDRSGNFSLVTNDPKVKASVASEGFAAADMVLNNNTVNNVSLGKQNMGAVSATNHIAKMNDENSALLRQALDYKPAGTLRDKARIDPIDSVVFINYLEKNIKEEKTQSGEPYSGKVILSFTVNKKGRPENIKTEQSLCDACDKQAVALLLNGPKWIYSFGKRKQVVIEFHQ